MRRIGYRWLPVSAATTLVAALLWSGHTPEASARERAAAPKPAPHGIAGEAVPAEASPPRPEVSAAAQRPTPSAEQEHSAATAGVAPEEAMKMLLEGNDRVARGKARGPNRTAQRRGEVASAQHPFAVVVTCSDSRVPPELLFDQGYGDLFVVRTAGNVIDDVALGSIEYAVEHLGARLILVLGHSKCGAVKATIDGGEVPGHLSSVVAAIQPAVEMARKRPGDLLPNAIKANVRLIAQKIIESVPGLPERLEECVLRVAGGYYDLDTGKVQLTYQPVI